MKPKKLSQTKAVPLALPKSQQKIMPLVRTPQQNTATGINLRQSNVGLMDMRQPPPFNKKSTPMNKTPATKVPTRRFEGI